jgi:two-component system cell cycle response regulator
MTSSSRHVVLVDPDDRQRDVLAGRLRAQGFEIEAFGEPLDAANWALGNPPHALIADVWMNGVSGVQLCRLLRSEPSTSDLPIILRAEGSAPKARFWAEQAGASAYVPKGRIGDLVRALDRAIDDSNDDESFFTQLAQTDIRDRIARQLDRALFESVISSSVRALGTCESFDRLFDRFSQFVCRVTTYRWLAICTAQPLRFSVHSHPQIRESAIKTARGCFGLSDDTPVTLVEDEDAIALPTPDDSILHEIRFGSTIIGKLAIQAVEDDDDLKAMMRLIANEIGGPIRIATLVEESRRLALYDPLTGILNRRAFVEQVMNLIARTEVTGASLSCILFDIDHFKNINDSHGHRSGDKVLSELGRQGFTAVPAGTSFARWGGEEFVMALPGMDGQAALEVAESLRRSIEALVIMTDDGQIVPVTVSLGVATLLPNESFDNLVERADHAMYAAKVAGRNRVEFASEKPRVIDTGRRNSARSGRISTVDAT